MSVSNILTSLPCERKHSRALLLHPYPAYQIIPSNRFWITRWDWVTTINRVTWVQANWNGKHKHKHHSVTALECSHACSEAGSHHTTMNSKWAAMSDTGEATRRTEMKCSKYPQTSALVQKELAAPGSASTSILETTKWSVPSEDVFLLLIHTIKSLSPTFTGQNTT